MKIVEIINEAKKKKGTKEVIIHNRIHEGEAYPAIITDCYMHKEGILKIKLIIYSVSDGVKREFFFNLKNSTYYLDNVLDMLNVHGDDLTELIGKAAIVKISRKEQYENLIIVKEISQETLCKEVEKLEKNGESLKKEETEFQKVSRRMRASRKRKIGSQKSRANMVLDYEEDNEEVEEDTDVEEIEDIDFDEED